MQSSENPFEGITFPQYRKYKNGKRFFKIFSADEFEEKSVMGKKMLINSFKAKIFPDRNFIYDLLVNYNDFAEVITPAEYEGAGT